MRVIVCLTTHPGRNGTVQPTIDSLHAQTVKPHEIRLYYTAGCNNLPQGADLRLVDDLGPLTKLSAAADDTLDPDDLIVTVDDDHLYHPEWLRTLLDAVRQYPDEAVGFSGWNAARLIDGGDYDWSRVGETCDVLEGFAGAAYRKRWLSPEILQAPDLFRGVDDVWISGWLNRIGVKRRVIGRKMATDCDNGRGLHHAKDFRSRNRRAATMAFQSPPPKLTICIPSMHSRAQLLARLLERLTAQPRIGECEILVGIDDGRSIVGDKRNALVTAAAGSYIAHFDDDDVPGDNYIAAILAAIESAPGVDAVLIRGRCVRNDNGKPVEFDYRIGGDEGEWIGGCIWRTPNHLCPIRADIAKAVPFPELRHGEDLAWGVAIRDRVYTTARAGKPGEILYNYELDVFKARRSPTAIATKARTAQPVQEKRRMTTPHSPIFIPQYTQRSGPGSTLEYSEPYRQWLADFIKKRKVKSVVDLGCGDQVVMANTDIGAASYQGFDVIPARVEANRKANPHRPCEVLDFHDVTPPAADLIVCKDVLQHWSTDDVQGWLKMLAHAKFKYALLTNCAYGDTLNKDCKTGGWRALDVSLPPFGLGKVVFEWGPDDHRKKVVLVTPADLSGLAG